MTAARRQAQPENVETFTATLPAGAFAAAVARAAGVIAARTTIPILAHALLTIENGTLSVTGTNLDQVVRADVPAAGAGALTVPGLDLKDALAHLKPGEDVAAAYDPGRNLLVLKQGRTTYKLPVLPVADFPLVTAMQGPSVNFAVDAATLSAALKSVEMAVSTEETRFYLAGVFFDFTPIPGDVSACTLVATDGHRLHKSPLPIAAGDTPPDVQHNFILPTQAIRPLLAACEGGGTLAVTADAGKIRVTAPSAKGGAVELTSKLIEGTYPDWRRVVPKDPPGRAVIDAAELLAAVDRVGIIVGAQVQNNSTRKLTAGIKLSIADGEILLSNRAQHTGEEADTSCAASVLAGEPIEIGFNATYLAAALRSFGAVDTIELAWSDPAGPVLLTVHGAGTDNARVVMPMRV